MAVRKKTAAQLNKEIVKALTSEKDQLYSAMGYAGNTPEQVKRYHNRIDEIDATLRTLERKI